MDDPALDATRHIQALRGLERINRLSGSARLLWGPLRKLFKEGKGRPLKVLDVATGAGDLPVRLWRRARRAGLPLEVEGCDRSGTAVEHAREKARRQGADVRFFQRDALEEGVPAGYDVVMSSLFLHHLSEEDGKRLFRNMGAAAEKMVLVNDLERNQPGLLLARTAPRLLSRSPVVHRDSVLSVRAAYTIAEVRALAGEAGLREAQVFRRWPFRFVMIWRKG